MIGKPCKLDCSCKRHRGIPPEKRDHTEVLRVTAWRKANPDAAVRIRRRANF